MSRLVYTTSQSHPQTAAHTRSPQNYPLALPYTLLRELWGEGSF